MSGVQPPAILAAGLARGAVVQVRHAAPESSAMGRPGSSAAGSGWPPKAAPPSRRGRPHASIALDRDPGHPAGCRPRSVAGRGRAFGACCFAGKLRSPAPPTGRRASPGPAPRRRPLRQSLRHSLRQRWRTPPVPANAHPPGGVERPRRKVRIARLIQRRGRDLGRTSGPRRPRRRSEPDLVATHGGAGGHRARQADELFARISRHRSRHSSQIRGKSPILPAGTNSPLATRCRTFRASRLQKLHWASTPTPAAASAPPPGP